MAATFLPFLLPLFRRNGAALQHDPLSCLTYQRGPSIVRKELPWPGRDAASLFARIALLRCSSFDRPLLLTISVEAPLKSIRGSRVI